MPQELYAATVAPDLDGTERLWLGDSGDPYYLTLNRLFYKNAAGRMFTDVSVNIDNGTGGSLVFGDPAVPGLQIDVIDGASASLETGAGTFRIRTANGTLQNSGGSATLLSWTSAGCVATFAPSSGVRIYDADSSHTLRVEVGSDLTANRTFTLTTGNANRTLDISAGSVTITAAGNALTSAANAADQRTALGLGTMALQAASAVNITGGTMAGVPIDVGSGSFTAGRIYGDATDGLVIAGKAGTATNAFAVTTSGGTIILANPSGTSEVHLGNGPAVKLAAGALGNYANDAAAASGGVGVGYLYRNGSVLMIRVA